MGEAVRPKREFDANPPDHFWMTETTQRRGLLTPIAFENQQKLKQQGAWKTRGCSSACFFKAPSLPPDRERG
jgi:hypothetical protein